ncbi:MAG: branched chain amino acid ABC transporter substrate-binding protein [Tistrella sp.]|uniref:Branched chain amino acid ABC transporter substrate-binding protein n=1 Tax=Tistrella mobilis TaxID=171437 RepID=A0A3B9IR62_9PROT|nr:branched-chain amino acid ABC transporter substrate-binding protein [Tistrella sp.]MAD39784.1 branched chain amino acid ABC transporter substrate-binding protein [Tistrella sp.]MBA74338.1 branched chain amino acid ABC transporter substrate-binding protein [Tistrella sp.]HAE50352.1 branched chain amino acid ABC transporter substrate-binding protein [Tistrella mobilis]
MTRTSINRGLKGALLGAVATLALAGAAQAEIVISVAGPMTGQYAVIGTQMRNGAEMAVKDINAAGGVNGEQLRLVVGDDACDPKQAVSLANKLVSDGVVFVAGHWCSSSSIPASDIYNDEGIVQISPGSTNPQLTERGLSGVFRTCGRDDQQGEVAAAFINEHFKGKKVAILHDKTTYGQGLADETKKNLNKLGVQEAMYEAYTAGEKDYSALVTKMKNEGIELIYVGGYHTESALIQRQAKEAGLNAVLMSGDAMVTEEWWSITGPAGEGALMTFSPDPKLNQAAAPVVAKFQESGFDPEGYTLYTYGAVQAWAQAANAAKSVDFEAVNKNLHSMKFDTVLGNISFDAKGDVAAPGYVVYKWSNGKYAYY